MLLAGAALSLVWPLCVQAVDALETPHGDDSDRSGVTLPRPASIRPFAASAAAAGKEATWDAEDGAEDGPKRRGSAMEVDDFRCDPAAPVAWTGACPSPQRSHPTLPRPAPPCCLCLFAWATMQDVPNIVHEVTDALFYWGGQCSSGYTGAHDASLASK